MLVVKGAGDVGLLPLAVLEPEEQPPANPTAEVLAPPAPPFARITKLPATPSDESDPALPTPVLRDPPVPTVTEYVIPAFSVKVVEIRAPAPPPPPTREPPDPPPPTTSTLADTSLGKVTVPEPEVKLTYWRVVPEIGLMLAPTICAADPAMLGLLPVFAGHF